MSIEKLRQNTFVAYIVQEDDDEDNLASFIFDEFNQSNQNQFNISKIISYTTYSDNPNLVRFVKINDGINNWIDLKDSMLYIFNKNDVLQDSKILAKCVVTTFDRSKYEDKTPIYGNQLHYFNESDQNENEQIYRHEIKKPLREKALIL